MNGYTPVSDQITQELGVYAALVYGKIWRYNQMSDEVCRASQGRMARELGVSDDTVNRYIKKLVQAGYIVDATPELRNKPHLLRITAKDAFDSSTSSGSSLTSSGSTPAHSGTNSRSQRHEDSNKRQYKKAKKDFSSFSDNSDRVLMLEENSQGGNADEDTTSEVIPTASNSIPEGEVKADTQPYIEGDKYMSLAAALGREPDELEKQLFDRNPEVFLQGLERFGVPKGIHKTFKENKAHNIIQNLYGSAMANHIATAAD